jgi:ATP-binding cassette subfamily F protein 3
MKKEEEKSGVTVTPLKAQPKSSNGAPVKKTKEQKRAEAEARNKLYSTAKPVKDKISKIEKEIKSTENKITELEAVMALENFYNDAENVKKINSEYKNAKDKLTNLYHDWMDQTNKLNELEKQT